MKKILFGLLTIAAGAACAQSSVTIYGVLDSGIVAEGGGKNGNVTKVSGGASSGSRLGLRGKEDLGGGNSALFVLESGINVDDGTLNAGGGIFGRQAFVGLSSRDYGTLTLGRQYSLIYLAVSEVSDPFKVGSSGRANNVLQMAGTRINNAIRYTSPMYMGFNTNLQYAAGEVAGREAAGRRLDAELQYANGPLAGRLIYSTYNDAPTNPATALNETRTITGMASYQYGQVKFHAGYATNKNDIAMDSRDGIIGVTYTSGKNRFVSSVINHNDRTSVNADVTQYAVGAYHGLSPRTELYFIYSRMRRENAVAASTFFVGNASDVGSGDRGLNLGLKHTF